MSGPELHLYFAGTLSSLGSVANLVQKVCRRLELDEITSYHIELAVIEAVTNGIRHAFEGDGPRPMHVAATVEGSSLLISVNDRGRPADLTAALRGMDRAAPAELEEGGRGLFLICSLMDHVEHCSDGTGNTLLMTKKLPLPASRA